MKTLRLTILTIAVMALVFGATAANADSVTTYDIINYNGVGVGSGPFGTITATLTGTTLTVDIKMNPTPNFTILDTSTGIVGANVTAAAGFTVNQIGVVAHSIIGYPTYPNGVEQTAIVTHTDSVGSIPGTFGLVLSQFNPGSTLSDPHHNFEELKFTLTNVGTVSGFGLHLASLDPATTFFAVTQIHTGAGCDANGNNCGTTDCGLDCGVGQNTPEPASLVLLGSGLLGIGGISRKRFAKKAF